MRPLQFCATSLFAVSLAWCASSLAAVPATSAKDRADLEEINAAWLNSYETRDPAALRRVLATDFVGVYGDRALSKAQMLEGLATRPPTKAKWADLAINVNGNTAVVTAISTITFARPEGEAVAKYRYADIYRRRGEGWQAVASHVVKLDD